MKKILTALAFATMIATTVGADLARIEMGAGSWLQTPYGGATTTEGSTSVLSLDGDYRSNDQSSSKMYFWMLIKHPLPLVPNLRLEYVSIADEGETAGTFNGVPFDATLTIIEMDQYDIIAYYNLVDNTGWASLDAGLGLKVIQSSADIDSINYSATDATVAPILYLRTRSEIPATNIGLEADVKYITNGDTTMYNVRAKIDYTLEFIPTVQPALELGYRIQKYDVDNSDTKIDLEYSGIYAGLMLRF